MGIDAGTVGLFVLFWTILFRNIGQLHEEYNMPGLGSVGNPVLAS